MSGWGRLRMLEGKVDIYLPDLKFAEPELAKRLCSAEELLPGGSPCH